MTWLLTFTATLSAHFCLVVLIGLQGYLKTRRLRKLMAEAKESIELARNLYETTTPVPPTGPTN